MKRVPKTKREEKIDIWLEEALQRADRSFEQEQREFVVFDKGTLLRLIREIVEDLIPPEAKKKPT